MSIEQDTQTNAAHVFTERFQGVWRTLGDDHFLKPGERLALGNILTLENVSLENVSPEKGSIIEIVNGVLTIGDNTIAQFTINNAPVYVNVQLATSDNDKTGSVKLSYYDVDSTVLGSVKTEKNKALLSIYLHDTPCSYFTVEVKEARVVESLMWAKAES